MLYDFLINGEIIFFKPLYNVIGKIFVDTLIENIYNNVLFLK